MGREMEDDRYRIKRDLTIPLVALVATLAAVGAGVWWATTSYTVSEDKILIAVVIPDAEGADGAWWGQQGEASVRFLRGIKEPLEEVGFEVLSPSDPAVLEAVEGAQDRRELVERARALGAGVLLTGRMEVASEQALDGGAAVEVILQGDLELLLTEADDEDIKTIPARALQVGPDRQDAVRVAAQEASRLAFDELVAAIVSFPAVAALFDKAQRTPEQAQVANAIEKARNFVDLRAMEIQKRDEVVAGVRAQWGSEAVGPVPVEQLSPFGREDYLVGVLPGGVGVIGTVKERRTRMDLESFKLVTEWQPERQDFIGPGGATHAIFEAHNIFSHPAMARGGAAVAVVTEEHGLGFSLRLVKLDPATGQALGSRVLLTVGGQRQLAWPEVSPDGSRILFGIRDCARCNTGLELIQADGGGRREIFKADDWRGVGDAQWVGEGASVAFVIYHDERPRRFMMAEALTGEQRLVHENGEVSYINERFSPDGSLLAYVSGGPEGRQLVVRRMSDGMVKPLTTDLHVKRPSISFDNALVAFEATGQGSPMDTSFVDPEVAVVPVEGGEVRRMTVNAVEDRHLRWAPDRREIFFETVIEDPQRGEPWVAIRRLSVP